MLGAEIMREFVRVSPSQINDYNACKRLWWFVSIYGLDKPQKASAALGEETHAVLEEYLINGVKPDPNTQVGAIATPGLALLPPPGTVHVELDMTEHREHPEHAVQLELAGVPVSGRIDVLNPASGTPEVWDHKTTGNMLYAKTEEELKQDPQMVIYGSFALKYLQVRGHDCRFVRTGHVVYATKGPPQAKRTAVVFSEDALAEQWAVLSGIVTQMKETAQIKVPAQVPANLSACSKYGGCHFRDKCRILGSFGASPFDDIFNQGGSKESLAITDLDSLVGDQTSEGEGNMSALLEKLKAAAAAKAAEKGGAAQSETANKPAENKPAENKVENKPAETKVETAGAVGVVPPDAPASTNQAAVAEVEAAVNQTQQAASKVRRPQNYKPRLAALGWSEEQIDLMSPEAMRSILEDGITADSGSKIDENGHLVQPASSAPAAAPAASSTAAATGGAAASAAAPAPEFNIKMPTQDAKGNWQIPDGWQTLRTEFPPPVQPAPGQTGLVLYIDCLPEKGWHAKNYVVLEDALQPFMAKAAEHLKVPHYSVAGYNDGPKTVAMGVSGNLAPFVARFPTVVCTSRLGATNAVLEMLIPYAETVIRGR